MRRSVLSIAAVAVLVIAACGDDDDDASSSEPAGRTPRQRPRRPPAPRRPRRPRRRQPTEATRTGTEAPAGTEAPDDTGAAGRPGRATSRRPASAASARVRRRPASPIKLGCDGDEHPGRRLHVDPEHGHRLLRLRQRQRRHQRPADRVHRRGGAGRPAADRLAGDEADRAGPGARHRRQHQPHRVQRQPRLLRRAGVLPDHRRRRPGLLHQPQLLRRQHGPVLLEPRRRPGGGAGRAPKASSSSSRRTSPGST